MTHELDTTDQQLHADDQAPAVVHTATVPPGQYLMSLTGFDEIAIAANFGQKVTSLRQEDAVTVGRALAFVHYRREEGGRLHDKEAHDKAMGLTMQQVVDFFPPEQKSDGSTDQDADGVASTYADQAVAVVRIGIAPSEWKALTAAERDAIIAEHNHCADAARGR